MITLGSHMKTSWRSALEDGWRLAVSVSAKTALATIVNVNAGCGMVGIFVDGILHLSEQVVKLDKILLCSGIGHGQVVLLSKRVLSRCWTTVNHGWCRLGHVLLGGSHGTVGNRERTVERQE